MIRLNMVKDSMCYENLKAADIFSWPVGDKKTQRALGG